MNQRRAIRIGVIADTHGLFDPAIRRHFRGVDHILHAGDIGDRSVIEQLEQIAPVTAVSGNVDEYEHSRLPLQIVIRRNGKKIAVCHVLYAKGKLTQEAKSWLDRERPDICVFGHSHRSTIEQYGPTLLFNPGSAGPKRFSLPRGIGLLTIQKEKVLPKLIRLNDNARRRIRSTGVKLPKKKGGTT
jgi:putative phosphoesterase